MHRLNSLEPGAQEKIYESLPRGWMGEGGASLTCGLLMERGRGIVGM